MESPLYRATFRRFNATLANQLRARLTALAPGLDAARTLQVFSQLLVAARRGASAAVIAKTADTAYWVVVMQGNGPGEILITESPGRYAPGVDIMVMDGAVELEEQSWTPPAVRDVVLWAVGFYVAIREFFLWRDVLADYWSGVQETVLGFYQNVILGVYQDLPFYHQFARQWAASAYTRILPFGGAVVLSASIALTFSLSVRWYANRVPRVEPQLVEDLTQAFTFKDLVLSFLERIEVALNRLQHVIEKSGTLLGEEMAIRGSEPEICPLAIQANVGLLYAVTRGDTNNVHSRVFVGLCGRVGDFVITAAHNFAHHEQLLLVPAMRSNRQQTSVLDIKKAIFAYASVPNGDSTNTWTLDMVAFRVKGTFPLLKSVEANYPRAHTQIRVCQYDPVDDILSVAPGRVDTAAQAVLLHTASTQPGSSGGFLYQVVGNRISAVGLHLGQAKPLGRNYAHFLSAYVVATESNDEDSVVVDHTDVRIGGSRVPLEKALTQARRHTKDAVELIRVHEMALSREQRARTNFEELGLPELADHIDWADDDFGEEGTGEKPTHAKPFRGLSIEKFTPDLGYVEYLKSLRFEPTTETHEPVGAYQFQVVGKLPNATFGKARSTWSDIEVVPSIEEAMPYAGKYVMPPKDGKAQLSSLFAHAALKTKLPPKLKYSKLQKACDRVLKELRRDGKDLEYRPSPFVLAAIRGEAITIDDRLAESLFRDISFKMDARPGYVLIQQGHSDKRSVLEQTPADLVRLAYGRIRRLAQGHIDRDPIRIFIKDEPHTLKKRDEGRWRIISSISMVDEFVEKLLLSNAHHLIQEAYTFMPAWVGLGNQSKDVPALHTWLQTSNPEHTTVSSDVSGFDFHVDASLLLTEARIKAALITGAAKVDPVVTNDILNNPREIGLSAATCPVTACPGEVLYRLTQAIITTPFVTADGVVVGQGVAGVQRSGRYNTSPGNSVMRTLMQYYIDRTGTVASASNGDDNVFTTTGFVEEDELAKEYLSAFGVKLTDVIAQKWDGKRMDIEFCSHHYTRVGDSYEITPLGTAKSVAKFVANARTMPLGPRLLAACDVADHLRNRRLREALLSWAESLGANGQSRSPDDEDDEDDDFITRESASGVKMKKATKQKQQPTKQQPKKQRPRSTAAAKAPARVSAPSATSSLIGPSAYKMQMVGRDHVRLTGHEILGQVVGTTGETPQFVGVFDANPACWVSSRLALVARAYEKYRYNKATIRYIPAVGTTTEGSIAIAVETDPDEALPGGPDRMIRTMNSAFATMGPMWEHSSLTFKRDPSDQKWYTASQLGSSERGEVTQFVVYANATVSGFGNRELGYLVIEYDLDFLYPELENQALGAQFVKLREAMLQPGPAGSDVTIDSATTTDGIFASLVNKIIEIRPSVNYESMFVNSVGDYFDIKAGAPVFAALVGTAGALKTYKLFATLDAARVGTQPLKWTNAVGAYGLLGFARLLVDSLTGR